jgi:hypothetical protein
MHKNNLGIEVHETSECPINPKRAVCNLSKFAVSLSKTISFD